MINIQTELKYFDKVKIYLIFVIWHDPSHQPNHPYTHPTVRVSQQIINVQTEVNYLD